MKEGDEVIYARVHAGHNRNLKKHRGRPGTIQCTNLEHRKREHLIKFGNGSTFWINESWLEKLV